MAHFSTHHVRNQANRCLDQVLRPHLYLDKAQVSVEVWEAPGEPVPFEEAVAQPFATRNLAQPWGRAWGTTWFHIRGTVPEQWTPRPDATAELITDLGFTTAAPGFQCEALAYDPQGTVLKATEPHNRYIRLLDSAPGATVDIYLEAASNPDMARGWSFAPTQEGSPHTASPEPLYTVQEIALGLRDLQVAALITDLEVLLGLAHEIGDDTTRGTQIVAGISRALQQLDPRHVHDTAPAARDELAPLLAAPAHADAHRIAAVGHAHIDSAWLWPIRETARKVARTFSNVLDLMEQWPDFRFAASSAQQYQWLKEQYPELFERLRAAVRRGQFIPVGGMWVESDSNMPGAEAMARQFVEGTRFFREEFGFEPAEVWLPDSFGYSAAMPQIAKLAGAKWFLTQKLSWNEVNRMPHHTFWWEGIDGSRVFTHFPPADTYGSDVTAPDIHRSERQYSEKAAANSSLLLFGYGDGGGGPTREMLERAKRCADLAGSPTITLTGPREFFASAEDEYRDAPVWSGEMYLEFHRGVFTSQAACKRGNRRTEALLHEAELWAATAAVRAGFTYPYEQLRRIWQQALLYQFHDILPGTSIAWVHDEVVGNYERMSAELEGIIADALGALAPEGATELVADATPTAGGLAIHAPTVEEEVQASEEADGFVLTSVNVRVVVDRRGRIVSAVDTSSNRDAIAPGAGGNVLQLYRDRPTAWDAWNLDYDYELVGRDLVADVVRLDGTTVVVETSTGASTIRQRISLLPGRAAVAIDTEVDWADQEQVLKLGFGLDVHATCSSAETQFGYVQRPVHRNTTWDAARFEIPVHRWIHVGEPSYGVALATSVYGHDVSRTTRDDGGTTTTLRASLLRGPRYPDPDTDQGNHTFRHVLRLDAGIAEAVDEGYRLALPERRICATAPVEPLAAVEGNAVRIETVKLAQDGSGDVVVRLYEALGGRASTVLSTDATFTRAAVTDLHEQEVDTLEVSVTDRARMALTLRPFQILTVRLSR